MITHFTLEYLVSPRWLGVSIEHLVCVHVVKSLKRFEDNPKIFISDWAKWMKLG